MAKGVPKSYAHQHGTAVVALTQLIDPSLATVVAPEDADASAILTTKFVIPPLVEVAMPMA
jgi:hypothetical protein